MNTKTVFSVQYNGNRYQVRETRCSSTFVKYDILQNRRVVISDKYLTKRTAILMLCDSIRRQVVML